MEGEKICTIEEAASYLKVVDVNKLTALRRKGEGPKFAVFGNRIVYKVKHLDEWLESQFQPPKLVRRSRKSTPAKRKTA